MHVRRILPALAFLLFACSSAPESAAEDFARAASSGNTAAALERLDPEIKKTFGAKLPFAIEQASRKADARGGLKSIATEPVSQEGDQARVRLITTYHDGSSDTEIARLRRVDGQWYVSM